MLADMHTHSENSHDSVCKIEDMYNSQIMKGTEIFAVTDHFDTSSFDEYDVYAPIIKAHETVKELNKKIDKGQILSGIEIGEGFWFPEVYDKIMSLVDYDVIIGSVHLVKYKKLTYAYSKIDFTKLSRAETEGYIDAYFDDMLTMLEFSDFDILAHLTCPISRYIKGKYELDFDISPYEEKIERILKTVIKKEHAFEVNTSAFGKTGEFMPDKKIIKNYYDLGGRLITLGSDAHIAENASQNFLKAVEVLKAIGFKDIYYYKNRKPYSIKI